MQRAARAQRGPMDHVTMCRGPCAECRSVQRAAYGCCMLHALQAVGRCRQLLCQAPVAKCGYVLF
eukprot:2239721-Alexandrium_andersonii.AAC.1